jgi:hypothetical protein
VEIHSLETKYTAKIIDGDELPVSTSVYYNKNVSKLTLLALLKRRAKEIVRILYKGKTRAQKIAIAKEEMRDVDKTKRIKIVSLSEAKTEKLNVRINHGRKET